MQDFFIERGGKAGGGEYIVMVYCFSQSVCFFIIKSRNKKKKGGEKTMDAGGTGWVDR